MTNLTPSRPSISLGYALKDLERHARSKHRTVRVTRVDGSIIEGDIVSTDRAKLVIAVEQDPWRVDIPLDDIRGIEIAAPAKGKEFLLVLLGIVGSVTIITGYASITGDRSRFTTVSLMGFVFSGGAAAFAFLVARTRVGAWLKEWQQIYPPG